MTYPSLSCHTKSRSKSRRLQKLEKAKLKLAAKNNTQDHSLKRNAARSRSRENQSLNEQSKNKLFEYEDEGIKNERVMLEQGTHPEYKRLVNQLDIAKYEKLSRARHTRDYERQAVQQLFDARKRQAWDEFYNAKKNLRFKLVRSIQAKIAITEQEIKHLTKKCELYL
ncbi:hypothetical protein BDF14DRAFT_1801047 [Spinellus fusiger]|nr:hypothetical protein BDF14DRAFT_1801047 [Spinellus fusiger]